MDIKMKRDQLKYKLKLINERIRTKKEVINKLSTKYEKFDKFIKKLQNLNSIAERQKAVHTSIEFSSFFLRRPFDNRSELLKLFWPNYNLLMRECDCIKIKNAYQKLISEEIQHHIENLYDMMNEGIQIKRKLYFISQHQKKEILMDGILNKREKTQG